MSEGDKDFTHTCPGTAAGLLGWESWFLRYIPLFMVGVSAIVTVSIPVIRAPSYFSYIASINMGCLRYSMRVFALVSI